MLTDSGKGSLASVAKLWEQLEAVYEQTSPTCLTPDWPPFITYAWEQFDPKSVMEMLLSSRRVYKPLKKILLAGICSWVIAPENHELRKEAMMLIGKQHLCHLELLGKGAFPNHQILGDAASRISPTGRDFFRDFYHPIGEIIILLETPTFNDFSESLRRASEHIENAIGLMTVLHMHSVYLNPTRKFARISLKKAAPVASRIYGEMRRARGWDERNILRRWQRYKKTYSLVYAAAQIRTEGGESLLDLILKNKIDFDIHEGLIPTWFGYARYVTREVLGALESTDARWVNEEVLPQVETISLDPPPITQSEKQALLDGFAPPRR